MVIIFFIFILFYIFIFICIAFFGRKNAGTDLIWFDDIYLGEVLFYRDKKGQAVRRPSDRYRYRYDRIKSKRQWTYYYILYYTLGRGTE